MMDLFREYAVPGLLAASLLGSAAAGAAHATPTVLSGNAGSDQESVDVGETPRDLGDAATVRNAYYGLSLTDEGLFFETRDDQDQYTSQTRLVALRDDAPLEGVTSLTLAEHAEDRVRVTLHVGERAVADFTIEEDVAVMRVEPLSEGFALRLEATPRHLIVPTFIGDDFLFNPEEFGAGQWTMPLNEHYVLLLGEGNAMLQPILLGDGQQLIARVGDSDGGHVIESLDIAFHDEAVYLAGYERADLWQDGSFQNLFADSAEAGKTEADLEWRPPFPAGWRAVFHGKGRDTAWFATDERRDDAEIVHGRVEYVWPFWIENGQAKFAMPHEDLQEADPAEFYETYVIYPLRRSPARMERPVATHSRYWFYPSFGATPSQAYVPEDGLRFALGDKWESRFPQGVMQHTLPTRLGAICSVRNAFAHMINAYHGAPPERQSQLMQLAADRLLEEGIVQYERSAAYQSLGERIVRMSETFVEDNPGAAEEIRKIQALAEQMIPYHNRMLNAFADRQAGWVHYEAPSDDPIEILEDLHRLLRAAMENRHAQSQAELAYYGDKLERFAVVGQNRFSQPRYLTLKMHNQAARVAVQSPDAQTFAREVQRLCLGMLQNKHWSEGTK
ncbi:hypothetical protein ACERK3_17505 [Phycisphaerales bacterium AB-hyl4]|uniref:Uncharacterized protein n=1 Tax=Natronomicrosphaera hydrolytica TaxID=3242702 RepID=A0ABV4UAZ4_9BACT